MCLIGLMRMVKCRVAVLSMLQVEVCSHIGSRQKAAQRVCWLIDEMRPRQFDRGCLWNK